MGNQLTQRGIDPGEIMVVDDGYFDSQLAALQAAATFADAMYRSSLLPEHLRTERRAGKVTDLEPEQIRANCLMVVNQALAWRVNPFSIMPSTFVVGGKLGFDGKLIAAIVNKLGGLVSPLSYGYEGQGDDLTITVSGQLKNEAEPRTVTLSVREAKTDNQMWKKDPKQKLVYSGVARWARRHTPGVLLGIMTEDEIGEVIDAAGYRTSPSPAIAQSSAQPVQEAPAQGEDPQEETAQDDAASDPPSTADRMKERIRDAVTRPQLEQVMDRVRAAADLTEEDRQELTEYGRFRWSSLPQGDSDE